MPPHNGALVPVRLPILKAAISNQPAYNGAVFCSSFACAIHLKEGGRVDLEQKNWTELFEINGAPYGSRTRLYRWKNRAKFSDINGRFHSACNVPVIEDQLLGDESKRDFRPGRRTNCIGTPQIPHVLVSLQADAAPRPRGSQKPLPWVGRRDGGAR